MNAIKQTVFDPATGQSKQLAAAGHQESLNIQSHVAGFVHRRSPAYATNPIPVVPAIGNSISASVKPFGRGLSL